MTVDVMSHHEQETATRDRLRDALSQLKSCQLITNCTKNRILKALLQ